MSSQLLGDGGKASRAYVWRIVHIKQNVVKSLHRHVRLLSREKAAAHRYHQSSAFNHAQLLASRMPRGGMVTHATSKCENQRYSVVIGNMRCTILRRGCL